MPNTQYLNSLLNAAWLGGRTFKPSPYLYLACSMTDPADGVVEPSGNSYARVTIPNDDTHWEARGPMQVNAQPIVFPQTTGDWGTVTHLALYDNSGKMLWFAPMQPKPKLVEWGDILTIPAGALRAVMQ